MIINFRKMAYSLERVKSLSLALKIYAFKGNVLVDQNTANIRANTCVACHNNVSTVQARTGCALCSDSEREVIEQVKKTIFKGQVTDYDQRLQCCDIDGSCNKLAVWLFHEHLLKKEDANEFPCYCWKKEVK